MNEELPSHAEFWNQGLRLFAKQFKADGYDYVSSHSGYTVIRLRSTEGERYPCGFVVGMRNRWFRKPEYCVTTFNWNGEIKGFCVKGLSAESWTEWIRGAAQSLDIVLSDDFPRE